MLELILRASSATSRFAMSSFVAITMARAFGFEPADHVTVANPIAFTTFVVKPINNATEIDPATVIHDKWITTRIGRRYDRFVAFNQPASIWAGQVKLLHTFPPDGSVK